jgi:glycosyltransferase involved in cell wall biosynthesis
MPDPFVNVIVTAFNRDQYLQSALWSTFHQDCSSDMFDVTVVKNFRSQIVDSFIERRGGRVIDLPSTAEMGEYYTAALERTNGDVICLLDDDDFFLPDKIRRVANQFALDSRLSYYHNRALAVDDTLGHCFGDLTDGPPSPQLFTFSDSEEASSTIRKLFRKMDHSNNSSISVRRSLLTGVADYLAKVEGAEDDFLFYAAILRRRSLLFDVHPLTLCRVISGRAHRISGDSQRYQEGQAIRVRRRCATREVILHMVRGDPILSDYARLSRHKERISRAMIEGDHFSSDVARDVFTVGQLTRRLRLDYFRNAALCATISTSIFSPKIARRVDRLYWQGTFSRRS